MIRLITLSVVAAVVSGVVVYQPQAASSGPLPRAAATDHERLVAGAYRCQTEVDGKLVPLQPGQGVKTDEGWRNCESYDGHTLIIYSARPPDSAAGATVGAQAVPNRAGAKNGRHT